MSDKYKAMKRKLKKEKELNEQLTRDRETFLTDQTRESSESETLRKKLNEKE